MKRKMISILVLTCMLLSATGVFALTPEQTNIMESKMSDAIALYIGNPNAFVNYEIKQVDEEDSAVVPFIKDGRTLVPLRFISESVGAQVDWDPDTATATVTKDSKIVKMTLGQQQYTINGTEQTLDVPADSYNDRIFIPIRAMVNAIDKQLFWDDRGLIVISDYEELFDVDTEKEVIDELIDIILTGNAPIKVVVTPPPTPVGPVDAKAEKSPSGTKMKIASVTVSDTPQVENGAKNAIDGKLGTRWSAEGLEQWVQLDLSSEAKICCVGLGVYLGSERSQKFDIAVSKDGTDWTVVCQGESSGTSDKVEYYNFPEVSAKYVKINCKGNSVSKWNSLSEVEIYAKK